MNFLIQPLLKIKNSSVLIHDRHPGKLLENKPKNASVPSTNEASRRRLLRIFVKIKDYSRNDCLRHEKWDSPRGVLAAPRGLELSVSTYRPGGAARRSPRLRHLPPAPLWALGRSSAL